MHVGLLRRSGRPKKKAQPGLKLVPGNAQGLPGLVMSNTCQQSNLPQCRLKQAINTITPAVSKIVLNPKQGISEGILPLRNTVSVCTRRE